ncbi:MAG: UpxY family transcription antiterminator [Bryobacteraceae bacterium]
MIPHPWYAISVKPNAESTVTSMLTAKGYETFLPAYRVRKQWSDRVKEMKRPLFPRYTFCRFDFRNRLPIVTTCGVVAVVGFGDEPAPVAESEIEAVRVLLDSGLPVSPWPFLREGQRVSVVRGPLTGAEGVFFRNKGDGRLVVTIDLLQRSIATEIDAGWIKPA